MYANYFSIKQKYIKKRIRELKGNYNYNVFCAQENAEMN